MNIVTKQKHPFARANMLNFRIQQSYCCSGTTKYCIVATTQHLNYTDMQRTRKQTQTHTDTCTHPYTPTTRALNLFMNTTGFVQDMRIMQFSISLLFGGVVGIRTGCRRPRCKYAMLFLWRCRFWMSLLLPSMCGFSLSLFLSVSLSSSLFPLLLSLPCWFNLIHSRLNLFLR